MDIQSITSSIGAYSGSTTQASQLQQSQQGSQVTSAEQREPKAAELTEAAPRPVVNTDGQTTGKLINVTA